MQLLCLSLVVMRCQPLRRALAFIAIFERGSKESESYCFCLFLLSYYLCSYTKC
ncbi:superoxide dismutase [Vibrio cholerae]|nr:superoxide dismutase [Vibrio cholerae]